MDLDQILRLLAEREAAARAEQVRLEQESARITALIEACRWEADRLATAREVLSGLVGGLPGVGPAGRELMPEAVVEDRLLEVLAEWGRPVRCRDVAAGLGTERPAARQVEMIRHRLKKLVGAGRVVEAEPGLFTLTGDSGRLPE
jgi:hypothetical protein